MGNTGTSMIEWQAAKREAAGCLSAAMEIIREQYFAETPREYLNAPVLPALVVAVALARHRAEIAGADLRAELISSAVKLGLHDLAVSVEQSAIGRG